MDNETAEPILLSRIVQAGARSLNVAAGKLLIPPQPRFMRTGSRVTEGCATVDARAEENGNTRLAVRVRGLAPAASFAPDSTVYVVWTQSQDGTKQNVGALGLSGDREGTLDTTTSHRKSLVMVTPEPSGEVRSPPTNGSSPSTSSDLTPDVGPTAELTERRRLQGTSGPNATPRPS